MISSISIHDVVDIDVEEVVIQTERGELAITKYNFITKDGSKVEVSAFLAEEEDAES